MRESRTAFQGTHRKSERSVGTSTCHFWSSHSTPLLLLSLSRQRTKATNDTRCSALLKFRIVFSSFGSRQKWLHFCLLTENCFSFASISTWPLCVGYNGILKKGARKKGTEPAASEELLENGGDHLIANLHFSPKRKTQFLKFLETVSL